MGVEDVNEMNGLTCELSTLDDGGCLSSVTVEGCVVNRRGVFVMVDVVNRCGVFVMVAVCC